jgi:hypothetical protein
VRNSLTASRWDCGSGSGNNSQWRRDCRCIANEELHAALSGYRLLVLWNALPDVEKRKKVGDRNALIDQLWSAIEISRWLRRHAASTSPSRE